MRGICSFLVASVALWKQIADYTENNRQTERPAKNWGTFWVRLWDFIVSFHCSDLIKNKLAGERPHAYQTSLQVTPLESHFTVTDGAWLAGTEFWIWLLFVGSFERHGIIRDGLDPLQLAEKFLLFCSHSEEEEKKNSVQNIFVSINNRVWAWQPASISGSISSELSKLWLSPLLYIGCTIPLAFKDSATCTKEIYSHSQKKDLSRKEEIKRIITLHFHWGAKAQG